jgi:hypothetical protein
MKFTLSFSFAFILLVLFESTAFGQFRVRNHSLPVSYFVNDNHEMISTKKWSLPGLAADKQSTIYKPSAPLLSLPVGTTSMQGESYWMGSITTQSYNQGKIGRFYYWDIQGNLRGSNLFLDIAGKNKRGLKLVFPRYRAIF